LPDCGVVALKFGFKLSLLKPIKPKLRCNLRSNFGF